MAKPGEPYFQIVVESYRADRTAGLHGPIHIRPVAGQGVSTDLRVECSKRLSRDYPVGTKFRLWVKLTDLQDGGEFLYSHFRWAAPVISETGMQR